jgi:ankyrin repeat protein
MITLPRQARDKHRQSTQKQSGVFFLQVVDARGNTPLHCAARNGHLDCVQLLLDAGVESIDGHTHLTNSVTEGRTGATPLMLACAPPQTNAAIVRALLKHGAAPWMYTARERMAVIKRSFQAIQI